MEPLKNYIKGQWVDALTEKGMDVINPSNGAMIGNVPLSSDEDVMAAAAAAYDEFQSWRRVPVATRCSYLFKLHYLLEKHSDELARLISLECGKSQVDAEAEMKRAIQNVEVACGMPMLMQGEKLEGVANDIDGEVIRQPVGVFAIISPFNFPAMVPFWFLPYAIASGNTVIVKPSEQVPLTMQRIFELIHSTGLPKGVVNLVHGDKSAAQALLSNPKVQGVSFVGSTRTAKEVAFHCVENNKRYQALGSAKNFLLVMEDANLDQVVDSLLTSCFGCAGQRCMAASVVAAVPAIHDKLLSAFVEAARSLKVGDASDPLTDVGPVISQSARERILSWIEKGVEEGARLELDGRNLKLPETLGKGSFVGPTIFSGVRQGMTILDEELFGPVVCFLKIDSLEDGLQLIKASKYGNGASVFTQNGFYARKFQMEVNAGMVGINVGIPAPVAYFPFGGVKQSIFADIKAQGRDVINFYTERKVVTIRF